MERSKGRASRFGPPNNFAGSSAASLMDLGTGKPRNYGNDIFSAQKPAGSSGSSFKTPEQLAFDSEFTKWEKSFDDWKRSYANHPDRNAYREYEQKFLSVREKLLEKRKQIYGDSKAFGKDFNNHLLAADAMANSILSKYGESSRSDFREDNRYIGGYSRDGRDDRSRESYPLRDMGRDHRGRDNYGMNSNRGGRGGNQMRGGDNRREMENRRGGSNSGGFGRRIQKPTPQQIQRELSRRDVYPFTKWVLINKCDRPALVGKRAKKLTQKIQNVLERKRQIANGEVPLEELPWPDRVEKMFEIARNTDCPKLLPGSGNRRLRSLRKKKEEDLTADERKFIAYCDYVFTKRSKYFEEKKKLEGESAPAPKEQEVP